MPITTEKYCASCGTPNPISYIDESVKVSRTKVIRRKERRHIPKRAIVAGVIVTSAVIMGVYFANLYALNNMQFRIIEVSAFQYSSLSSDIILEACNPTAFPAAFETFSTAVNYQGGELGRMSAIGGTVLPYQAAAFDGKLQLSARTISGLIVALAGAIGGNDSPYDENDITMTVTVDARILGVFPYSESREFTFSELRQFMSIQQTEQYQCG
jgi:hypothetical protein